MEVISDEKLDKSWLEELKLFVLVLSRNSEETNVIKIPILICIWSF